ncbi:hypothetical protein M513_14174 [Trichuris suis]|uniref:Uncharacterized protein n=1 Tax=Trichuris suis TaxID=68888 RepID=A0A085LJ03_9BILA|nr:hypothetical protein M513_14174 [Trichuris suis]
MPGTLCATHSTWLPQMLPGANVQRSLTKKPRSHSHRSITVRVSVNCVVRVQFCSELCCCVIVEPIPTLRNKKSMLTVNCEFVLQCLPLQQSLLMAPNQMSRDHDRIFDFCRNNLKNSYILTN